MQDSRRSTEPPTPTPSDGTTVPQTYRLRATLRQEDLEAVSRELREALASRVGALAIDLAAVTAIDPMGLQLLLAARAGERAEGRSLAFVAASQAVCELCEAVGLPLAHWVKVG